MSKPQIVIVPGAWNSPEGFDAVIKDLESHGYTVHTQQLPSVGHDNPPKDLTEDVEALQSLIIKAMGIDNDVVVVAHSWGGIVAGSAATGMAKKSRQAKHEKGGVTRLAYIAAFLLPEGVSMMNACGDQVPGFIDIDGPYAKVNDATALFNDLSPEQKEEWTSKLQPHAFASMQAKSTGAAWSTIPTSYLLCERDEALPPSAQESMVNNAKESSAIVELDRLSAGHFPFLTQPDAVAKYIRKAAGETI